MDDSFPAQVTPVPGRLQLLPVFYFSSASVSYQSISFLSAGITALTGYYPAEFSGDSGLSFENLIETNDYKRIAPERKKALETKQWWEGSYNIISKQGKLIRVLERTEKVISESGDCVGFQGQVQVDDLALHNSNIAEKNLLFESLNHSVIVSVTDINGVITYVNDAFCNDTGYSSEELIGKTHRVLNSGYHSARFFKDLWQTILSGTVWRGEIRNKSKSGNTTWYATTISPVLNQLGELEGFITVRSNITDKKNAEDKLKAARDRLRFINENSPDLLITTDLSFRITYVNHSRSGFDHAVSPGNSILDFVDPAFRERFKSYLQNATNGIAQEFEMPGYLHDFHLVWYVVRIAPIGSGKTPDAILVVSTNITNNKLAEEKTLESEKRFRMLFERNLAGVYRCSLDNVLLECNDAFARMIGFRDAAEVMGKSLDELYFNYSKNDFSEDLKANNGSLSSYERCIELNSGKKVYLLENASVILQNSGEPAFIEGTVIDITERKESEKELLRSKEHYKMLLENMNDGLLVDDLDGKITFANRRCCEIFGYSLGELAEMQIEKLFDSEYHEILRDRHNRRVAGENVTDNMEYRGVRKNGARIWLEVHVNPIVEDGGVIGTQSVIQDITERKIHEAEFKKLADLNRNIIDSSDELFYVIEVEPGNIKNHKMVYVSAKAAAFSGFTSSQILELPSLWFSRLHPDDAQSVRDFTTALYSSASPQSCIYRINHVETGEFVWLYDFVKPVLNRGGQLVALYGSIKNITELKQRESELEKTSRDLNNRYNELMQFNYIVSHNLRSPVANILGMVEILGLPDMTQEDKDACIEHIQTAVNRMDLVIKDLNSILETRSALNEKKESVSLHGLLENITATLNKQIIDSGTHFQIAIAPDADNIYTIRGYLESILYNLISNAIKYKAADRRPEIEIVARKVKDQLSITVSDNGSGIDLKKFGSQVFGLYKRFNSDVEGKGLGLYMTRTQVETLGGKISVQSTSGTGTTFTVQLPVT